MWPIITLVVSKVYLLNFLKQFMPGLLKPSTTQEDPNISISDTISHISDTNTLDVETDRKNFDKKFNESTITLSSKYGSVSIDN